MSCDQSTMDHNVNELNEFSLAFCLIRGSDYMIFCMHFIWTLNICAFYVYVMCYVIFIIINYI